MIDPYLFFLCLLTSLVLLLTPGPAVLYVLSRSLSQGKSAGIALILGIGFGNIIHVVAATLGLSVVIMNSLVLFDAIKVVGAAYLIFLGIKTLRQERNIGPIDSPEPEVSAIPEVRRRSRTSATGLPDPVYQPKNRIYMNTFPSPAIIA